MIEQNDLLMRIPSVGPCCITPYLDAFASALISVGYTRLTITDYLRSAMHFGIWLDQRGIGIEQIDERIVGDFGAHCGPCVYPGSHGKSTGVSGRYFKRVQRFFDYLRANGVAKSPSPAPGCKHSGLNDFRQWLLQHRGLSERTVDRYERLIIKLLPSLGAEPGNYDVASIRQTILAEARRCSRAQAKTITTALRAYLRFLASHGDCRPGLDQAVPTVPEWRLSFLPRYLSAESVDRLIASCDVSTRQVVRDRAVLLFLARLGLRAGDITAMRIDDIDWLDGTFRVHGKGRTEVRLPLPQEVGDALLAYLKTARPKVPLKNIFLCAQAPHRAFVSASSVSDIVRTALQRAGIANAPSRGANLLRQSAATMRLRAGATLDVIATLLRHRSSDTTAHYAKVDVQMLRMVAQPWPEGAPC